MLTLQIDNQDIEEVFTEGFRANKEKFLAFIKRMLSGNLSKPTSRTKNTLCGLTPR